MPHNIYQEPTASVNIRIPLRVWQAISGKAQAERRTLNSVAAQWLEQFIEEHQLAEPRDPQKR